jgi:hypothetical protein
LKGFAWGRLDAAVRVAQRLADLARVTRRVDTIIYKVDRLGDWLLAQPTIGRLVAQARQSGGSTVIWASRESAGLRSLQGVDCAVEAIVFEPQGWMARARRTWSVIYLLIIYRTDTLYCLRHGPDPIRDFVLRTAAAGNVFALSWRIVPGPADVVPHEIRRHAGILHAAGTPVREISELLPRLNAPREDFYIEDRVVIAPYSSATVKDWPDSSWCELMQGLSARPAQWELWVGSDQVARARRLAAALARATSAGRHVVVRSGSLSELVQAIASSRLVLTVDTLAAHLAAALDVPMVGLVGGGQPGDFAPWSRSARQRWVSHRLPCYHCGWHCTRAQNDCVRLITSAEVEAEVDALWPRQRSSDGSVRGSREAEPDSMTPAAS